MKKSSIFLFVIIIFTLSVLIGCANNQRQTPQGNNQTPQGNNQTPTENTQQNPNKEEADLKLSDFFPLELGYTWEYEGEGNEYASFNRKVVFADNNLYQIREDNGGTVSAAVFKVSPSDITRIFFQGEAYGEESYLNSEPNENMTILKIPLIVGTKWQEPNGTREIVSINEVVTTPAGNYSDCIKVKVSSENSTVYEYFKDGIGMVKREFISGETKVTSSLKKFSK
jgi:hypothetical protein